MSKPLIGQIPQCLGDFSNSLSVLNLRSNRFQGNLPETFIEGSNLKTLDLSQQPYTREDSTIISKV
jgi:hypothetical protein